MGMMSKISSHGVVEVDEVVVDATFFYYMNDLHLDKSCGLRRDKEMPSFEAVHCIILQKIGS